MEGTKSLDTSEEWDKGWLGSRDYANFIREKSSNASFENLRSDKIFAFQPQGPAFKSRVSLVMNICVTFFPSKLTQLSILTRSVN